MTRDELSIAINDAIVTVLAKRGVALAKTVRDEITAEILRRIDEGMVKTIDPKTMSPREAEELYQQTLTEMDSLDDD